MGSGVPASVIDPAIHQPLLDDWENIAREANVPVGCLEVPMKSTCTDAEIEYVKALRRKASENKYGLVYMGDKPTYPMTNRMIAITAACLRNYIEARVMTLDEVLQNVKKGDMPSPTVLLIPNFHVGNSEGGKIADWQVSGLLSMLYDRQVSGKQTFLYVRSLKGIQTAYGDVFAQHILANFEILQEGQE